MRQIDLDINISDINISDINLDNVSISDLMNLTKKPRNPIPKVSLQEIIHAGNNDKGKLLGNLDTFENLLHLYDDDGMNSRKNPQRRLERGVTLIRKFLFHLNKKHHEIQATSTHYAIYIGQVLHGMKKDVKKLELGKWEKWADENLPFINKRTRQTLMQLVGIPRAWHYAFLGKERLIKLDGVIDKDKDEFINDPIKDFLQGNDISCDFEGETNIDEFKLDVDSAIFTEKAKREGVTIDRDKVKKLIRKEIKLNKKIIRMGKKYQDADRDPNEYLDGLLRGDIGDETSLTKPRDNAETFDQLIIRLYKTIDWLIENPDQLQADRMNTIEELEQKLSMLKEIAGNELGDHLDRNENMMNASLLN